MASISEKIRRVASIGLVSTALPLAAGCDSAFPPLDTPGHCTEAGNRVLLDIAIGNDPHPSHVKISQEICMDKKGSSRLEVATYDYSTNVASNGWLRVDRQSVVGDPFNTQMRTGAGVNVEVKLSQGVLSAVPIGTYTEVSRPIKFTSH